MSKRVLPNWKYQDPWSEHERAESVANVDALGHPRLTQTKRHPAA